MGLPKDERAAVDDIKASLERIETLLVGILNALGKGRP